MKTKLTLSIIMITLLSACNTPLSRIPPTHVIPTQKELGMTCEQLMKYKISIDSRIVSDRATLDSAAMTDTGLVAASVILLPVGLIGLAFTGTGDLATRYSEDVGKQRAIQELLIDKGC